MSDTFGTATLATAVDLSGLAKGLDKAEAQAEGGANRMGDALKGALGLAAGAAAAAAVAGVVALGAALFDASDKASAIKTALGDLADDEVQRVAAGADLISARYGKDMPEVLAAAQTLMKQFGITSAEAMDFVTKGFESGLNSSDDFLDTIGEYSNQFAQAGAGPEEFFSVMQTGLQGGVLGTDKAADAFKEFQIRIIDGSETTGQALQDLFGDVGDLGGQLDTATEAVEANNEALADAKGAYAASQEQVNALESALNEAQRALESLSQPRLEGMDEFDNRLAGLDMQAKQVKLSMLDMVPESDAYEAAAAQLEGLNTEMDRVALERDITFEPQLRAIEAAISEGTTPAAQSFDEVMASIATRKGEIADLSTQWQDANAQMQANGETVDALGLKNVDLVARLAEVEAQLVGGNSEMQQFLDGLQDGSLSGADAMQQVLDRLREMDDPIAQNAIGAGLFGTQWEDMGADAMLAINQTAVSVDDLAGSTDAAALTVSSLGELGPRMWGQFSTALIPVAEKLAPIIEEHMPTFVRLIKLLADVGVPTLMLALGLLNIVLTGLDAILSGDFSSTLRGLGILLEFTLGPAFEGIGAIVDKLSRGIKSGWDTMIDGSRERVGDFLDWIFGIPERLFEAGRDWIGGLLRGIREGWDSLMERVRNLASGFLAMFNISLGNASPSKYARAAMVNFWRGGMMGTEDMEPHLTAQAAGVAEGMLGAVTNLDHSRSTSVTMNSYSNAPVSQVVGDYNAIRAQIGGGT